METLESYLVPVLKKAGIAIIMIDVDGKIDFWNQGAKDAFGYTEEEVLGKKIQLFNNEGFILPFNSLDLSPEADRVVTTRSHGREGDLEGIRKNRTEFPCELTTVCYSEGVRKKMVIFIHDLSYGVMSFLKTVAKKLENIDQRLDTLEKRNIAL